MGANKKLFRFRATKDLFSTYPSCVAEKGIAEQGKEPSKKNKLQ